MKNTYHPEPQNQPEPSYFPADVVAHQRETVRLANAAPGPLARRIFEEHARQLSLLKRSDFIKGWVGK